MKENYINKPKPEMVSEIKERVKSFEFSEQNDKYQEMLRQQQKLAKVMKDESIATDFKIELLNNIVNAKTPEQRQNLVDLFNDPEKMNTEIKRRQFEAKSDAKQNRNTFNKNNKNAI